jgi:hypothetical protein
MPTFSVRRRSSCEGSCIYAVQARSSSLCRDTKHGSISATPSPVRAETFRIGIPGRTLWMLSINIVCSKPVACARSSLVMTATSAVLKIVGYLSGLSYAFGCGNQNKSQILAEVKAGRAHEVANVFDKQEVEGFEVPIRDSSFYHSSIKMTDGSCRDLFHRSAGTSKP